MKPGMNVSILLFIILLIISGCQKTNIAEEPNELPTQEQEDSITNTELQPSQSGHDGPAGVRSNEVKGSIAPGERKTIIDKRYFGNTFVVFLSWNNGKLSQELISPSGKIIDSNNFQSFPGIVYSEKEGLPMQENLPKKMSFFKVDNAEQGEWSLNVVGSEIDAPESYVILIVSQTPATLALSFNKQSYKPGDTIILTAKILDNNAPILGLEVKTSILEQPDKLLESLILYDDGLHDDGIANDGVYGNKVLDTSKEGTYTFDVEAILPDGGKLSDSITAFVTLFPDLEVKPDDITFSPATLTKGTQNEITISATIRNKGEKDTNNVDIEFYDNDPFYGGQLLGKDTINVPVGGSSTATVKVTLGNIGEANIYVIISSFTGFIESDYDNNKASKKIS